MNGTIGIKEKLTKIKGNKTLMNGALFSIFSFINRGFGFLLLLILANYMPPSEYGCLGLFQTVIMLMGYFVALQVDGYVGVSYFDDDKTGFKTTISCIYSTTFLVTCLFCIILLVGGTGLSDLLNLPHNVLALAIPICFLTVFTNINLDYYRLTEKVWTYGFLSCGNALFNFIMSIFFVKYMKMGWEGRVWAQVTCQAGFGLYGLLFFIQHRLLVKPNWLHWKTMLIWGIPLIPHMATNFLKQGCDRYIINASHTIDEVGLFTFALNLANIIIMVGFGFNQSDSVEVYKILGDQHISNENKINRLANRRHKLMSLYGILSILVILICYFLFPLFLPKYAPAINYFLVLGFFGFISCLYFLYTNYLFFFKKTRLIMSCTFGTSILHLILSLLFTKYSLYCTSLIYCISMSAMVFLIRHYALKELRNNLDFL